MERSDYGEDSSWNGQITVRVVHGTVRLRCSRARLALSIATCANGETNFSLAKQF